MSGWSGTKKSVDCGFLSELFITITIFAASFIQDSIMGNSLCPELQ